MPAATNRTCPVGPSTNQNPRLDEFERKLQHGHKAIDKLDRKQAVSKQALGKRIAAYRNSLDRICLGSQYARGMGFPLADVLADLEAAGGNTTKTRVKQMRDAMTVAKFGVLRAE